ncbi:olfactory receptor 2G6-like [Gastrophryne carolinensis]
MKTTVFLSCFFIYIVILVGNLLIIGLITVSPRLHSPMYFFLCNLSLCDIIFTTNNMPSMLYTIWEGSGSMPLGGCITQFYVYTSSGSIECVLLTAMAFDRYMAIRNPLRYYTIMNLMFCSYLAALAWLSGLVSMIILAVAISNLDFCGPNTIDYLFCDLEPILKLSSTKHLLVDVEVWLYATILGLLPFQLIVLSYVAIFLTIMKIPSETGRRKTFSTCSSHLASVCTYFGTIFIIYLVPPQYRSTEISKIISLFYTVVTPLFNPFIYSLRNKEMKTCVLYHVQRFYQR